jgi:hypothetical protein
MTAEKPHLVIALAGPLGHGKTTLTSALSRREAQEGRGEYVSPEEIYRRLNPTRGHLRVYTGRFDQAIETERRRYTLLDCESPDCLDGYLFQEHCDGAVFVLSPDDNWQSAEHQLRLLGLLGLPLVVFLNKLEELSEAERDRCEERLRQLLNAQGIPGDETPLIRGSAKLALSCGGDQREETGLPRLLALLDERMKESPRRLLLRITSVEGRPAGVQIGATVEWRTASPPEVGELSVKRPPEVLAHYVKPGDPLELRGPALERQVRLLSVVGTKTHYASGSHALLLLGEVERRCSAGSCSSSLAPPRLCAGCGQSSHPGKESSRAQPP